MNQVLNDPLACADDMRDRQARVARACVCGEKLVARDDPGMLALCHMLRGPEEREGA